MNVTSSAAVETQYSLYEGRDTRVSHFLGRRGEMAEGPQVFWVESRGDEGIAVRPHLHHVDQFQVFWSGQRIGSHKIRPALVHYADAFTPYGPIVDGGGGVTYMTMRACSDPGPRYMPEARKDRIGKQRGRLLTCHAPIGCDTGTSQAETLLGPFDDGLAVRTWNLDSGQCIPVPTGTSGGRQYLVLSGGLRHGVTPLPERSVIWVGAGESVGDVTAERRTSVLELVFPRVDRRPDGCEEA